MSDSALLNRCEGCGRMNVEGSGWVCADCKRRRKLERDRARYVRKTDRPNVGRPRVELPPAGVVDLEAEARKWKAILEIAQRERLVETAAEVIEAIQTARAEVRADPIVDVEAW